MKRATFIRDSAVRILATCTTAKLLLGQQPQRPIFTTAEPAKQLPPGMVVPIRRGTPLNPDTLGPFLGSNFGPKSPMMKTAPPEWRTMLRQSFALTSQQEAALNSMTKEEVASIQNSVNTARSTGSYLAVKLPTRNALADPQAIWAGGAHCRQTSSTTVNKDGSWTTTSTFDCSISVGDKL